MRRVEIALLLPGMVLAEPVRGPRGDVLLGAGVVLEDTHLRGLRAWGIRSVGVEGEDPASGGGATASVPSPQALAAAEAGVAPRFARCGRKHPVLAWLADEAVRRAATALAQGKPG